MNRRTRIMAAYAELRALLRQEIQALPDDDLDTALFLLSDSEAWYLGIPWADATPDSPDRRVDEDPPQALPEWQPAAPPPDNSRTVVMRFDDEGSRDCEGFYWRPHGCWYKSYGSKGRKAAVHPVAWRER